jgi:hypothetical protein
VRVKPLCHLSIQFIYNALLTRSYAKFENLILECDTVHVKESKTKSKNVWQKTPVSNLVRYVASGILFARIRVQGKLIRRSLKTKVLSVAKLRLTDLENAERQMASTRWLLKAAK